MAWAYQLTGNMTSLDFLLPLHILKVVYCMPCLTVFYSCFVRMVAMVISRMDLLRGEDPRLVHPALHCHHQVAPADHGIPGEVLFQ